jgi:hypothetical protein
MKAEHRHELKTNELAQWLADLPNWAKQNIRMLIYFAVVAAAVIGVWIYRFYQKDVVARNEQLRLSRLLVQLEQGRSQILQQQAQGIDLSYTLLQTANSLHDFARQTKKPDMAALAFIKYAQALRTELHYRLTPIDNEALSAQITKAKAGYEEAVKNAQNNPSLRAIATLGLGLCAEEIQKFDDAKQIYQQIVDDPALADTAAAGSARHRLDVMGDYEKMAVFKAPPAPKPAEQPPVLVPEIEGSAAPGQANAPAAPAPANPPAAPNLPQQ